MRESILLRRLIILGIFSLKYSKSLSLSSLCHVYVINRVGFFFPLHSILMKAFFTVLFILLFMYRTEFKTKVKLIRNQKKASGYRLNRSLHPYHVVIFADARYVLSSYYSLFPLKTDDWKCCTSSYPSRVPMDDHGLVCDPFLYQLSLDLCQLQSLVMPLRENQGTWMISWLL